MFRLSISKFYKKETISMTDENVEPEVEVEVADLDEAAVVEDAEIEVEADDAE